MQEVCDESLNMGDFGDVGLNQAATRYRSRFAATCQLS